MLLMEVQLWRASTLCFGADTLFRVVSSAYSMQLLMPIVYLSHSNFVVHHIVLARHTVRLERIKR